MNKMELVRLGWDNAYDQVDWYPPLGEALEGLTAEQANWRPEGAAAHTIAEIVRHLTYYKEQFRSRLSGDDKPDYGEPAASNEATFEVSQRGGSAGGSEAAAEAPEDGGGPAGGSDEEAWLAAVERLDRVHHAVRALLAELDKKDFERLISQQKLGTWAFSLIMHDAYHTGQIIQLRKLQGSWPATRSYS
ncbi:DinB family protein [Paenibacillus protaetiae]|uniref:DinB family protein n=1 Tax=Paenibacillus protaetiae TaxID=2509456 RepID=A0A4P6F9N3_9BACL|nr:DinB family protein [Paenibacillus protaetiae]QAY67198.1 DinB family protein [Paenibacillus protaetiae]